MKVKDFLNKCMPCDTMNICIQQNSRFVRKLTPKQIMYYEEYINNDIIQSTVLSFAFDNIDDTIIINIK